MSSFDFRKTVPTIIPVVLPASQDISISGRVRNITVRAADNSGWLEPSSMAESGWDLKQEFKHKRYMLLSEEYRLEGNVAGWEMYKRYLRDWQAGRTTQPFPFDLLPAEVRAKQRGETEESIDPWNMAKPKPTTGDATDAEKPAKGKGR